MLYIACDHAGFKLKEKIKPYLTKSNIAFKDLGCFSEESVDYPKYGKLLIENVSQDENNKGILICGTGIGMSIVANRNSHIRAGLCKNVKTTRLAREHNDINVLVLAGRSTNIISARKMVKVFLNTEKLEGRHALRRNQID